LGITRPVIRDADGVGDVAPRRHRVGAVGLGHRQVGGRGNGGGGGGGVVGGRLVGGLRGDGGGVGDVGAGGGSGGVVWDERGGVGDVRVAHLYVDIDVDHQGDGACRRGRGGAAPRARERAAHAYCKGVAARACARCIRHEGGAGRDRVADGDALGVGRTIVGG